MTMILNLDALQLNVSHFGRKYLQNNGFHEMAGLRTKASSETMVWTLIVRVRPSVHSLD